MSKIQEEIRKTGIDFIGDVPWSTHFCQFYRTKKDLIDILVPYFKAGLETNEFCMWVTSEPLIEKEAKKAMRKAVPSFDQYGGKGQIEVVPHTQWYLKNRTFDGKRVLNAWTDRLNQAISKGYDGMRVAGNMAWVEKIYWRRFIDYEEEVSKAIEKYRMIAICSYLKDKCTASETIDVLSNHQFAIIKRDDEWEMIEDSECKRREWQLHKLAANLQSVAEHERRHIAREIHDELGAVLTALEIDVSWLGKRLPQDQERVRNRTDSMSKLIRTTVQRMRRISEELIPPVLYEIGLVAAIKWQAEEFQNRTGVKCELTTDPREIILDKDRSIAIFRIFQEALTNVARHANATIVKASLRKVASNLVLKVYDDGKGITEKQVSDLKSLGLAGMRERARFCRGELKVTGLQNEGTTVTVSVPLETNMGRLQ